MGIKLEYYEKYYVKPQVKTAEKQLIRRFIKKLLSFISGKSDGLFKFKNVIDNC